MNASADPSAMHESVMPSRSHTRPFTKSSASRASFPVLSRSSDMRVSLASSLSFAVLAPPSLAAARTCWRSTSIRAFTASTLSRMRV